MFISFLTSNNFIDPPSELAVDTIALLCILFIAFTFRLAEPMATAWITLQRGSQGCHVAIHAVGRPGADRLNRKDVTLDTHETKGEWW